ncbi:MAG: histidine phosphatase family protein [Gaiella sp.]
MRELLLVRHAHARSNVLDVVSSLAPGAGLSEEGEAQAAALGSSLVGTQVDLGIATPLERSRRTLELALEGRDVRVRTMPELREIGFGAYEGGPLSDYRAWAWSTPPDGPCPGGGETRVDVARRLADALAQLLVRPEGRILAVSHALPVRYVLDAAVGATPTARIRPVRHAEAHRLGAADVERAIAGLRAWAAAPRFADD